MKNLISLLSFVLIGLFLASCGGGAKISAKSKELMDKTWTLDTEATRKLAAQAAEEATGITNLEEIEVKGDVKTMVDALSAKSVIFGQDTKDKSKLSYRMTYGKGLLKTSIVGYWNWNEDESLLMLREWDSSKGAEKEAKAYKVAIDGNKMTLTQEGGLSSEVYTTN